MAVRLIRRVFSIIILLLVNSSSGQYEVPEVKIQALKPKGFRASIPDSPGLSLFVFQGNINRDIGSNDVGRITGEVFQAHDGRWTFEDLNLELKVGDVINYYVVVSHNRAGFLKDNLKYTVTKLDDEFSKSGGTPTNCAPTLTTVRGGTACAGQTIFEETFDSFRDNVWQIEQYIPVYSPEYPFVSYQRLQDNPTVSVKDGYLQVTPTLQQNEAGFSENSIINGSLNLFSGCTAPAEACMKQAWGADILPPIISGRITTKSFAFTYGTVTVRAKLPQGDWLYPEILLEPFLKKYGSQNYASGVIKIASARGNIVLSDGNVNYSNKVLYGGAIMDLDCRHIFLNNKMLSSGLWGDDFHDYSVRWTPDRITLTVDGQEWARIEPSASGLKGKFAQRCTKLPTSLLALGSKMAPFDDHFYITLGMAAGSVTEFPDDVTSSSGTVKPWSNRSRKAMLNFWRDTGSWLATWRQPELLVDYVKVVAL